MRTGDDLLRTREAEPGEARFSWLSGEANGVMLPTACRGLEVDVGLAIPPTLVVLVVVVVVVAAVVLVVVVVVAGTVVMAGTVVPAWRRGEFGWLLDLTALEAFGLLSERGSLRCVASPSRLTSEM